MEMETENRKMASENVSRNFDSLLCFSRGRVVCVCVYVWVCVCAIRISLYVFPHLYLCVFCLLLSLLALSLDAVAWVVHYALQFALSLILCLSLLCICQPLFGNGNQTENVVGLQFLRSVENFHLSKAETCFE